MSGAGAPLPATQAGRVAAEIEACKRPYIGIMADHSSVWIQFDDGSFLDLSLDSHQFITAIIVSRKAMKQTTAKPGRYVLDGREEIGMMTNGKTCGS